MFPLRIPSGQTSLYDRFSLSVKRRQDHQCWPWCGAFRGNGYGQITEFVNGKRRTRATHRLAWEFAFGQIPEGLVVRHMCHNPACCNPTHLLLGTHKDNFNDKIKGNRAGNSVMKRGASNMNAKLTEDQVIAIRKAQGVTIYELADQYGVSKSLISSIRMGKIWTHVNT